MKTKTKFATLLIALPLFGVGCANGIDAQETSSKTSAFLGEKIGPIVSGWFQASQDKALNILNKTRESTGKGLSEEQKAAIDEWLANNGLNAYGDSADTMYAGGTPLFDEATGETKDRFEHLFKKFPNLFDVAVEGMKENLKR